MTPYDLDPLKKKLDELGSDGRSALFPALHLAQEMYAYLPEPVIVEISRALKVPLADLYGAIELYDMYNCTPPGSTINNMMLVNV